MAANVPKGSILAPGGAVVAPDPNDPICAAYALGLEDYCAAAAKGRPGDFNDYVFNRLNDPNLAATREHAIGFVERGSGTVQGLRRLANSGGPAASSAERVVNMFRQATPLGASGLPSFWYRILGAARVRGNLGRSFDIQRVLCPDAQRPGGQPVEIKRPTELESHPGQLSNYAAASPTGNCELVNCAACKLSCKDWDSDCQGPFPVS